MRRWTRSSSGLPWHAPFPNTAGLSDYTIPVEFRRGGDSFTPLEVVDKPDCMSATTMRAATTAKKARFIPQIDISCVLSLISAHGSLMDAGRYVRAAAVFDVTSGDYFVRCFQIMTQVPIAT